MHVPSLPPGMYRFPNNAHYVWNANSTSFDYSLNINDSNWLAEAKTSYNTIPIGLCKKNVLKLNRLHTFYIGLSTSNIQLSALLNLEVSLLVPLHIVL